ncbi:MAG: helix-turn-helix domain-containing protein [Lachnospira eligens]|jgi:putative transcriptional regulator
MIKIKLCEIMGREKMTRKKLAELTGVRPNTIGDLYRENVRKIDLQALDKICEVFECDISDILEYVPENKIREEED